MVTTKLSDYEKLVERYLKKLKRKKRKLRERKSH
jgi:hypothetical protein